MAKSIKVLTYNKAGFDKAVKHALSLGVKKTTLTFDANKSSLVVKLGATPTMAKSRAGYTPKENPYAAILDLAGFQSCQHLDDLAANKPAVKTVGVPEAVCAQRADIAFDQGFVIGYDEGVDDTLPQSTLKCVEAEVLTQNPIVWATMGIPFFKDNGLDIVENDGKMYTINTTTNTATEFTAVEAAKQAKKDLLAGEDSIYTSFAKNFELVDMLRHAKVLVDADSED